MEHGSEQYQVSPIPLCGVEVRGIDLKQDVDPDVVGRIKADVHRYRIMVFRDQGVVSGERQAEISRWFGKLDSQTFYKHPVLPTSTCSGSPMTAQKGAQAWGGPDGTSTAPSESVPTAIPSTTSFQCPRRETQVTQL